jgi:transcriptional antiterminator
MFSELRYSLLDLDKCSLHELIAILEKFSKKILLLMFMKLGLALILLIMLSKKKIERYNNEAMIPPKLGGAWIPKILILL